MRELDDIIHTAMEVLAQNEENDESNVRRVRCHVITSWRSNNKCNTLDQ